MSRHWKGPGELEHTCPCPKAVCGMVPLREAVCEQHDPRYAMTLRSGHRADHCPAREGENQVGRCEFEGCYQAAQYEVVPEYGLMVKIEVCKGIDHHLIWAMGAMLDVAREPKTVKIQEL